MERLDALVAGLGVLVVATALTGAVVSGPASGGAQSFQVGFPTTREALGAQQATINGDGSASVRVQVARANLTEVQFHVEVSGPGPRLAGVQVSLQVQGPGGLTSAPSAQTLPGPGAAATVTFDVAVPVGDAPNTTTVRAASAQAALAQFAAQATDHGTGAWTLTFTTRSQAAGPVNRETFTIVVTPATVGYAATIVPEVANPR